MTRDPRNTKTRTAAQGDRPNVFRLTYLATVEILGDGNPDPEEVAHREWLKEQLSEETERIGAIWTRTFASDSPPSNQLLACRRCGEARDADAWRFAGNLCPVCGNNEREIVTDPDDIPF